MKNVTSLAQRFLHLHHSYLETAWGDIHLKRWLSAFIVGCVATIIVPKTANAEVASEASIRELVAISGQEENIKLSIGTVLPAIKQMVRDIPEEQLRQFMDSERMVMSLVTTYQKYYTQEEIQDMLNFYKTPTGEKLGKLNVKTQREASERHLQSWRAGLINRQIQNGNFKIQQSEQER